MGFASQGDCHEKTHDKPRKTVEHCCLVILTGKRTNAYSICEGTDR